MRARAAAVLIAAVAGLPLAVPGQAGAVQLVPIGDFQWPTTVTSPPGDAHRLFVAEKAGVVELLHDGVRKRFLTLDPAQIDAEDDQGLLSMAFAPDYATSGRFYVYYTAPGSASGNIGTLAEYRRSAADPDAADPASRRVVLTVDHPNQTSHNGGDLQFGPDGLLYLSVGDGGGANDPDGNAQRTDVPLGKLLRVDPRKPDAVPAIHAFGLRNPWRFSFDRLTGDLVIADVGQAQREEIDFAPKGTVAGADYGWPCMEGSLKNVDIAPECDPAAPYSPPVLEYDHSGGRCAITGGYVVRTHDLESLYGRYLYVDYCGGDVRSVQLAGGAASGDASTGLMVDGVYTFGEDACGHVYLGTGRGRVGELLDDADSAPPPCPEGPKHPPPVPKDRTPPHVVVHRAFRQSLATYRSLYLRVRCDERCGATASALLTIPGVARRLRVPALSRTLAAGKSARFRLVLEEGQAARVRDSVRRGRRVRGTLRVAARDVAGNSTATTRPVLVVP